MRKSIGNEFMYKTISDFLFDLAKREKEASNKHRISHAPTIGNMYEGLTEKILRKVIPDHIDLRIAKGFISDPSDSNKLSDEIDLMIVFGGGERIPNTDKHIYPCDRVLALIEVKKNLYSKDLKSAYENVSSIREFEKHQFVNKSALRSSFEKITKVKFPEDGNIRHLSEFSQVVAISLFKKLTQPLRVVMGYNGFKSEQSLRESFLNFIKLNTKSLGYAPHDIPNLIVCWPFSLVKAFSDPYTFPRVGSEWLFLASYSQNPILIFLELLFNKIAILTNIRYNFDENDHEESLNPFISGSLGGDEARKGWNYRQYNIPDFTEQSQGGSLSSQWSPEVISESENVILTILCARNKIDKSEVLEMSANMGDSIDLAISSLLERSLLCESERSYFLSTCKLEIVTMPDGNFYAGENCDGRLSRWFVKKMEEFRK